MPLNLLLLRTTAIIAIALGVCLRLPASSTQQAKSKRNASTAGKQKVEPKRNARQQNFVLPRSFRAGPMCIPVSQKPLKFYDKGPSDASRRELSGPVSVGSSEPGNAVIYCEVTLMERDQACTYPTRIDYIGYEYASSGASIPGLPPPTQGEVVEPSTFRVTRLPDPNLKGSYWFQVEIRGASIQSRTQLTVYIHDSDGGNERSNSIDLIP